MGNDLRRLLASRAADIADAVRLGLESEKTPRYRRLSDALLRRRCRGLMDAFVESVEGDAAPLLAWVNGIASDRMAQGAGLDELQRALTLLEGRAWSAVVEGTEVERLVHDLGVVTGTIGVAKDALARR